MSLRIFINTVPGDEIILWILSSLCFMYACSFFVIFTVTNYISLLRGGGGGVSPGKGVGR